MNKANKVMPIWTVHEVNWQQGHTTLSIIREQVFINEQHVPIELEWDGLDEAAVHLLVTDQQGQPIGCTRILSNGSIGRMAVLKQWRNLGVGRALLAKALQICKDSHIKIVKLSAQTHAIGFYKKMGFEVLSSEYLDANIPHVDMQLML
jgi:predicted GNAT family N-acyltransferase